MSEIVNHPDHYQNIAGVEAIDILNDVVQGLEPVPACMLWNCMKYLLRFKNKNGVQDLEKAKNYLDWLIESLNKQETESENKESDNKSITSIEIEVDDEFSDFLKEDRNSQLATLNKLTRLFDTSFGAVSIEDIASAIGAKELVSKNWVIKFCKPYSIRIQCRKEEKSKLIFMYMSTPLIEQAEYPVRSALFKTYSEAIEFLNSICECINQDGFVTVGAFYQKLVRPTQLTDFKYGWSYTDLIGAIIYQCGGKYILEMPKARILKEEK